MRTGAEYREALRDGRKVWVMGSGRVDDVTTHPATAAMVEEYVAWYDRHFDAAWQDVLIAPATAGREATPWAFVVPKTTDDLVGMGRSFAKTLFPNAGNVTHTPAYGHLISMGVLTAIEEHQGSDQQRADIDILGIGRARVHADAAAQHDSVVLFADEPQSRARRWVFT